MNERNERNEWNERIRNTRRNIVTINYCAENKLKNERTYETNQIRLHWACGGGSGGGSDVRSMSCNKLKKINSKSEKHDKIMKFIQCYCFISLAISNGTAHSYIQRSLNRYQSIKIQHWFGWCVHWDCISHIYVYIYIFRYENETICIHAMLMRFVRVDDRRPTTHDQRHFDIWYNYSIIKTIRKSQNCIRIIYYE